MISINLNNASRPSGFLDLDILLDFTYDIEKYSRYCRMIRNLDIIPSDLYFILQQLIAVIERKKMGLFISWCSDIKYISDKDASCNKNIVLAVSVEIKNL